MAASYRARICADPIAADIAPADVLSALAGEPGVVLLDSAAAHEHWGRYSVVACRPLRVVTAPRGELVDSAGLLGQGDFTSQLRAMFHWVQAEANPACPYAPGWLGYLGYELGRHFERLPDQAKRDTSLGDLHLGFYDALAVYDHVANTWQLVRLELDERPNGAGEAEEILRSVLMGRSIAKCELRIANSGCRQVADAAAANPQFAIRNSQWQSTFSPAAYRAAVARCIEYIAAGDIFQVNLSQRFSRATSADPLAIYHVLRRRNPAWFGGYMAGEPGCTRPTWAVLSSSPELFLQCRGGRVLTRPIKGTRPRTGEPAVDAAAAADLLASPKDNAELAMIIDLLRNDLGRVCRYGSVRVVEPCRLEEHPTVYHLVGTVEGELAAGRDLADLLAATFPGGSITGAPKIRAMQIIDELEPTARGVYTGSLAHFGVDGAATLSIAIRTAVWDGGTIHVQAGGGIVADSTPDGEYAETLDKARALLAAVEEAEECCSTERSQP